MVYHHFSSMAMLTLLFVLFWNENGVLASQGCGSVVNNSLSSPGYPNNYPNNVNCSYSVPIPDPMALVINFDFFELESHGECSYDYLKIAYEKKESLGMYCGEMTGKSVSVSGDQAIITFFSDGSVVKRGFRLSFTTGSPVAPKVVSPAPVVRAALNATLTLCTANGTLPIYMAVIRNSRTLVNATNTARILVKEEGNYTCRGTSKYGSDERKFIVVDRTWLTTS